MKILLIEDDRETAEYIARGLSEAGHTLSVAADGRDGLFRATGEQWDLLIIDRMLPGVDGLSIVRTLRAGGNVAPILFLTTLGGVGDRVSGLDAGADDYLTKPFAFAELIARVNALGRRPREIKAETTLRVGDLELDLLKRTVRRGDKPILLQPREFKLLEYLMRHAGEVVTRTMLLESVWDFHFDPRTNVVETHISRLRSKIHREGFDDLIQTVRGAGYLLDAAA
ncbi:MAG: response regulator transcription factor [Alphaproteobacteria bacterium]|nr:response regulator transcription factor [Alphaproteobacteria bacterium]MBL6939377.1 response regulator transcription factor [Alphaproteobacteria bacterium]MBL7097142.1 response regulator transcription factor [Alphaproteobacteria bacterium]